MQIGEVEFLGYAYVPPRPVTVNFQHRPGANSIGSVTRTSSSDNVTGPWITNNANFAYTVARPIRNITSREGAIISRQIIMKPGHYCPAFFVAGRQPHFVNRVLYGVFPH